jgi:hypothetical protein
MLLPSQIRTRIFLQRGHKLAINPPQSKEWLASGGEYQATCNRKDRSLAKSVVGSTYSDK